MDDASIKAIVTEIAPLLSGRAPGKIFQLDPRSVVIDFRARDGYLFISVDPSLPRLYLIKRRVRDLEKQDIPLTQFALSLRKELSDMTLQSVEKDSEDRVVRFRFVGRNELEQAKERTLVAQLTGRSANLFLLNSQDTITHQLRPARGVGQIGEEYRLIGGGEARVGHRGTSPTAKEGSVEPFDRASGLVDSLSEALDRNYNVLLNQQAFDAKASLLRTQLKKEMIRAQMLLKKLRDDLASHAGAEQQKHLGDLLLANVSTARRSGSRVKLIDYFSADAPVIEIEVDEKLTLTQEAERRFVLYSRSKRAVNQINSRIAAAQKELGALEAQQAELEKLIARGDLSEPPTSAERTFDSSPALQRWDHRRHFSFEGGRKRAAAKREKIPGVRRYASSDGYEILVGRTSRDNDHLTFKVAKPNDLWLHAADYAGSHVVVRNSTRKEIPHRTLIEAAQLAAKFSQARKNPKVDVHYTERKFVSKVKGAAPGLVRMTRFRNIIVAPKEGVERL